MVMISDTGKYSSEYSGIYVIYKLYQENEDDLSLTQNRLCYLILVSVFE